MRITQWGEYGVLCSVYVASRELQKCSTVGAAEIAKAQGIALEYAQQILQRLRRGSIIRSVRGPQGGYKLARPIGEITLRDILIASEGDTFEIICDTKPLTTPHCKPGAACGLRDLWHGFKSHVDEFLSERTLDDLVQLLATSGSCGQSHGIVPITSALQRAAAGKAA